MNSDATVTFMQSYIGPVVSSVLFLLLLKVLCAKTGYLKVSTSKRAAEMMK